MKTKLKEKIKTRIKKLTIRNTIKVTKTFDCKHTREHISTSILKQESCAIAEMTARCALYK